MKVCAASALCEIMRSGLWFWIIDVEGHNISVLSPLLVLLLDKTGIPREKQAHAQSLTPTTVY
jgi:hypothetical protein